MPSPSAITIAPSQRTFENPAPATSYPSPSGRNPVDDLPTELLLQIARYTLPHREDFAFKSVIESDELWRSINHSLLGYSLVRKSWRPILEILYSVIGQHMVHWNAISQPQLLSYALERQPEVRHCLTQFVPARIREPSELPANWEDYINPDTETNTAHSTILQVSGASINHIYMSYESLYALEYPLSQLRNVTTCELSQWYDYEGMRNADIFSVLFPIIRGWARLSYLFIYLRGGKWDISNSPSPQPHHPPTFSLRTLSVSYGPFTGPQLFHLLSSSTHTLQSLTLEGVKGLSEADLYNILSGLCLGLTKLKIERCLVAKSPHLSSDRNLDLSNCTAVDIAISRMVNLTYLSIDDTLVTSSVIASKPPYTPAQSEGYLPSITIQPRSEGVTQWPADDMLRALLTSGWRSISMYAGFAFDDETADRVRGMAKERGIDISLFSPYLID